MNPTATLSAIRRERTPAVILRSRTVTTLPVFRRRRLALRRRSILHHTEIQLHPAEELKIHPDYRRIWAKKPIGTSCPAGSRNRSFPPSGSASRIAATATV